MHVCVYITTTYIRSRMWLFPGVLGDYDQVTRTELEARRNEELDIPKWDANDDDPEFSMTQFLKRYDVSVFDENSTYVYVYAYLVRFIHCFLYLFILIKTVVVCVCVFFFIFQLNVYSN